MTVDVAGDAFAPATRLARVLKFPDSPDAASVETEHQARPAPGHAVQFYDSDVFLLDRVTQFIAGALSQGSAAIVIATRAHQRGFDKRLRAMAFDIRRARLRGQYISLDADQTLEALFANGALRAELFEEIVGGHVERAAARWNGVRAFGELVSLLAQAGRLPDAVALEGLWNDLQQRRHFDLFCGYKLNGLAGEQLTQGTRAVLALHGQVIPAESYSAHAEADEQLRSIAVLQQQAASLAAEVAARERAETQLREALEAERASREAAERALRLRDEFVSTASHELRTPLTGIRGFVQLALRRVQREGQVEPERLVPALAAIAAQSEKMSELLNRLLDISRFEMGKVKLERHPTDVVSIVAQAVSAARLRSSRHSTNLFAPTALIASVDPLRFEQILANLLDNAIRYSPDGGAIEVAISQVAGQVEISVRDHGLGVPVSLRPKLFERYYQAHADGFRSGLGLGLAITRQIVELHGGQIRAEFPDDGGTRFVVSLPVTAGDS